MIYEYMICQNNDKTVYLKPVKEIDIDPEIFEDTDSIYILKRFYHIDESDVEMSFVIALDSENHPIAVYRLGIGDYSSVGLHERTTAIFSLLSGARSFMICHNHPGGNPFSSDADNINKRRMKVLSDLIEVELNGSYIITKFGWCEIDSNTINYWE